MENMSMCNTQKIKLLKIMEMLRNETDEQHPLKTSDICTRLANMGISCDRRTLYKDIATLNEHGYEVMSISVGHSMGYYVDDRSFSIPELRILIDAVQSANCITEKKTKELINKLAALGGAPNAEQLLHSMVCFETSKQSNEGIYYAVSTIEDALSNKQKVSFYYFDLDENGERIFRKNPRSPKRKRYINEPLVLVLNDGYYYLMCYSAKYENICNYRVDRMEDVTIEKAQISDAAEERMRQITGYTKEVFKMYNGEAADVVLTFDRSLIGAVYDKFGMNIHMHRIDKTNCSANVSVRVGPTFFGWVLQFAGKMQVQSPENVAVQLNEHLMKIKRRLFPE